MPTWRGLRTGSRTTQRPSTASWSPRRPGGRRQGGLEEPRIRTPHRAGPRRHRQRSNSHRHRAPPPHRPRRRPASPSWTTAASPNSASTTSSQPPTAPTPHSGKPGRAVYRQTADSGLTHVPKPVGSTGGGSGAGRAPVLRKRRVGGQPALLRRRWSKLPMSPPTRQPSAGRCDPGLGPTTGGVPGSEPASDRGQGACPSRTEPEVPQTRALGKLGQRDPLSRQRYCSRSKDLARGTQAAYGRLQRKPRLVRVQPIFSQLSRGT